MRLLTLGLLALGLSACETTPSRLLQADAGSGAVVRDSISNVQPSSGDYFFVYRVDGYEVANALFETQTGNRVDPVLSAPSQLLDPTVVERTLQARRTRLTLVGASTYATRDRAIASPLYTIVADLDFAPEAGQTYVVKGALAAEQSTLWLENAATGAIVGGKFLARGNTAASLFHRPPPVEFVPVGTAEGSSTP